MEEKRKKGELPAEDRDVPQVTGREDFDNVGQKGGDVTSEDRQGDSNFQGKSDVNTLSGKDADLGRGKDIKKEDELR